MVIRISTSFQIDFSICSGIVKILHQSQAPSLEVSFHTQLVGATANRLCSCGLVSPVLIGRTLIVNRPSRRGHFGGNFTDEASRLHICSPTRTYFIKESVIVDALKLQRRSRAQKEQPDSKSKSKSNTNRKVVSKR